MAWYYDPAHHVREMAAIWRRHWVYVGRGDLIDTPLSYLTDAIGDQRFMVLRNEDGTLAAYLNACRHRGSIILTEGTGTLSSKALVCPYHQWCYAAEDGRLVRTTSHSEPKGFDRADYGLFRIAVQEWRGCVFVNLDADAVWDAEAVFHGSAGDFENFPLQRLAVGHRWKQQMACNWKTFWDNFNECLHCPNIHPGLSNLVPIYGRRMVNDRDAPDWRVHEDDPDPFHRGGLRNGAETWSRDGSAQGHVLDGLSEADIARGHTYLVSLPGTYMVACADHIRTVRLNPIGPELTEMTVEWLFSPEALADESYDPTNVTDFVEQVIREDMAACEKNQLGLHAAPLEAGVLMPEEYYLKDVHDWVRRELAERAT